MGNPTHEPHANCPGINLSTWDKGINAWKQQHISPTEFSDLGISGEESHVILISTNANNIRECPPCRQYFTTTFGIPELWWSKYARKSNGYFGCETTRDECDSEIITSVAAWSRFLIKQLDPSGLHHKWYKINIFTRWLADTNQSVILVFDAPYPLAKRLPSPLLDPGYKNPSSDPFWTHLRVLEEVVTLQDSAVWTIRTHVRGLEKARPVHDKPRPDYERLHDLSRHAIHVTETLDVAIKTTGYILRHHKTFMEDPQIADNAEARVTSQGVHEGLIWFEQMLESIQSRSQSNKERLQNEIQLAFHSVAQYDSGLSLQIGRAAQLDSKSMKTIAFLTMTFLPATFISAIFSMSFFDIDDSGNWSMSNKMWVYWACALPVTFMTVLSWYLWQRRLPVIKIDRDAETRASSVKFLN